MGQLKGGYWLPIFSIFQISYQIVLCESGEGDAARKLVREGGAGLFEMNDMTTKGGVVPDRRPGGLPHCRVGIVFVGRWVRCCRVCARKRPQAMFVYVITEISVVIT